MNRRQFLGLSTIGLGVTAGCLSLGPKEVAIENVHVTNFTDENVSVELRIEWNGEQVSSETYQIPGADENRLGSLHLTEGWPDEPGRWTVSGRLSGGEWDTISSDDRDTEVVALRGMVDGPGTTWSGWGSLDRSDEE